MNTLRIMSILFLLSFLLGCEKQTAQSKPEESKSYTVKRLPLHKTLHFTGTIQPLRERALTTPMDAVIETMYAHYGEVVKKDQVIFTLNSVELQRQYNETLTEYLKAKDSYRMDRARFAGTEALWKSGLLSKNNYLSEKYSLTTARLSLIQASRKLSDLLEKTEEEPRNLSHLSFSEFDRVRLELNGKHNLIQIKSPCDGVLLYPPHADSHSSIHISSGVSIKSGEVLGLIGDLNGIRVEIDVSEVDVGEIKTGMPAIIRGVAFGKQELKGKLINVNAQASARGRGNLPSFTAIVEVNELSQEQQAWLKVGMSSEIELTVDSMDKLLIPIAAVQPQAGQSLVKIRQSNGQVVNREVKTGTVEGDKVAIDLGLKEGEVIVYG